jgi:hypothetical protein
LANFNKSPSRRKADGEKGLIGLGFRGISCIPSPEKVYLGVKDIFFWAGIFEGPFCCCCCFLNQSIVAERHVEETQRPSKKFSLD